MRIRQGGFHNVLNNRDIVASAGLSPASVNPLANKYMQ